MVTSVNNFGAESEANSPVLIANNEAPKTPAETERDYQQALAGYRQLYLENQQASKQQKLEQQALERKVIELYINSVKESSQ